MVALARQVLQKVEGVGGEGTLELQVSQSGSGWAYLNLFLSMIFPIRYLQTFLVFQVSSW